MKKGQRRKDNKRRHKMTLTPDQLSQVQKARKKLRKNPAFKQFNGEMPTGMVEAACDLAVLSIMKTLGVSSKSILDILVPITLEQLNKQGVSTTEIEIAPGVSIGLAKKPEA